MNLLLFLTSFYTDIPLSTQDAVPLDAYLSQPYFYCGKGAQVIAYESADGQYVLKLFKKRHEHSFKLKKFYRIFKKASAERQLRWKEKFTETTRRYRLAFRDLKEETGLIHLHFEKTPTPLFVSIEGKVLDIAPYPFIIQKKAVLIPAYLKAHPEQRQEIKKALKAFFKTRLEKGYSDPKQSLHNNYGFLLDNPIQIDVGKIEPFHKDQDAELSRIETNIDSWFSREK